jgi:hypothetical protein
MFSTRPGSPGKGVGFFLAAFFLAAAALITYSQTRAFVWDEGFHLVAAALIAAGKRPYVDFCFPQTPINAYFNAALIRVFGQDWHAPHLLAALFVVGAMVLIAQFILAYLPAGKPGTEELRWTAAICAAVFAGLNTTVVQFGTVAQAYGSGLFFGVAAFRAAVAAVRRKSAWLAFAAGLLAGVAAGCSLLTAPVAAVLLLWSLGNNQTGNRWHKCAAFVAGAAFPFAPVLRLFVEAPRQVFFNIVQYQTLYRRANWPGATRHDLDVMTAWLDSPQALFLGLLALAGIWRLRRESAWSPEFRLAAWLCLGLGLCIALAHPTFERYFVFVVPFASILAVVGLSGLASRRSIAIAATLFALSGARRLFEDRDTTTWKTYETVVRKVAEVTPPGGTLYAEELVYFRLGRTPPTGLEFSYTRNLQLPPEQEKLLHVVSQVEFKKQIRAGRFATVQSCKDDLIDYYELSSVFPNQAEVEDCSVFWGKVKTAK